MPDGSPDCKYMTEEMIREAEASLPEAFVARMKEMLGDDWLPFLKEYTEGNYRALRFNRRKVGFDEAKETEQLKRAGVKTEERVPWAQDAWYYEEEARPGRHPYHDMGIYYIQEPSAMSAASLLQPQPGERILDLCAAPGGKTTQTASLLGPEGLLIANEIIPNRSVILSQNIERMGIDNCIVTNEDGKDLRRHFPEYFHRILVDAPCSGEGMFRKNTEAREEWSPENVEMCADRQQEILGYAAEMLMPGGTLVYSTCTFAPLENEAGIRRFLHDHPEFSLLHRDCPWFSAGEPKWAEGDESVRETFRLWPHLLHGEGHFAAVLKKDGEYPALISEAEEETSKKSKKRKAKEKDKARDRQTGVLDREKNTILESFLKDTVDKETGKWILSGNLKLFGDQLYRLPDGAPSLDGIRVQRAGLHIGTFLKNRLEPSHALALRLGPDQAARGLELDSDDPRTTAYFRGEAVNGDGSEGKGWCLVCVDGFSAGWGKADRGTVKNHYPKGLRWMR